MVPFGFSYLPIDFVGAAFFHVHSTRVDISQLGNVVQSTRGTTAIKKTWHIDAPKSKHLDSTTMNDTSRV